MASGELYCSRKKRQQQLNVWLMEEENLVWASLRYVVAVAAALWAKRIKGVPTRLRQLAIWVCILHGRQRM